MLVMRSRMHGRPFGSDEKSPLSDELVKILHSSYELNAQVNVTDDIPYKYLLNQPSPSPLIPQQTSFTQQVVYLGTGIPEPLFRGAGIEDLGLGIAVAPDCRLANVEIKLGAAIFPIVGLVTVSE